MWESWPQGVLQCQVLFQMYIEPFNSVKYGFPIFGMAVTVVSLLYGVSTFNLKNILNREPLILELCKFMFIELFFSYPIFFVQVRLFYCFIVLSYIYFQAFYGIITLYLVLIITIPKGLNILLRKMKFPADTEPYMLKFFPIYISSCYRKCESLSQFHFYRRLHLVINILTVMTAVGFYRARNIWFGFRTEYSTAEALETMQILEYYILMALAISAILSIIELLCINNGNSFLDWAFEKAMKEKTPEMNNIEPKLEEIKPDHHKVDCKTDNNINKIETVSCNEILIDNNQASEISACKTNSNFRKFFIEKLKNLKSWITFYTLLDILKSLKISEKSKYFF